MNGWKVIPVLLVAYLAVFLEASFRGPRLFLSVQIDLLPALMVYASLRMGLLGFSGLAVFGGLAFDSLSANPLGASVLPLFAVGSLLHANRERVLREEVFAQFVIGLIASAVTPLLTLLVLVAIGARPMLGWPLLGQWFMLAIGGGIATPLTFALFAWIERTFSHPQAGETSFRPDRELDRGRF